MDSLLLKIDKSGMTTDILYDRVVPFSGIQPSEEPRFVDKETFIQAWSEMQRASYTVSYDVNKIKALFDADINIAQMGVLQLKYNYIDYGTDEHPNLIIENGYYKKVTNNNLFKEGVITLVGVNKKRMNND